MKLKTVARDEWILARKELLKREKELSRLQDQLSEARRNLPCVQVDKNYQFQGPEKKESLAELFGKRSQLIVYHFMLHPDWEAGCVGCSFLMDNLPAHRSHLLQKDVSFVVVSRAPIEKIEAFKKRMGWDFKWVSSFGSDFNYDYKVSFTEEELKAGKADYNYGTTPAESTEEPGLSVFLKDESGAVFHTYSTYARGLDSLLNTYRYLDLTPKGRDEASAMEGVKHHDKYPPLA